jgi:hypothetical protein
MNLSDQRHSYNFKSFISHFLQWKWLVIALFVGSILNLVNQWEGIVAGTGVIDISKLIVTYVVPYLVSSFSAWLAN